MPGWCVIDWKADQADFETMFPQIVGEQSTLSLFAGLVDAFKRDDVGSHLPLARVSGLCSWVGVVGGPGGI